MAYLQILPNNGQPRNVPITRTLVSLGSSSDCDIQLDSSDVLPVHCTIAHEPGRYVLEISDRAAVVLVAGKKVKSHLLQHGDTLRIGDVELVFSALDATVSAGPTDASDERSTRLQLDAMRKLLSFSQLLAKPGELPEILGELIDQVMALTSASKGFLVLGAGAEEDYRIAVARNLERGKSEDPGELLSDQILRQVLSTRTSEIISDAYNDQRFQASLSVMKLKLSSVMCVPLLVQGELLGAIYVGNDRVQNLFRREQLELLQVFAAQAALFIKQAQDFTELRKEASTLTKRLSDARFGEIIGACPQMIEIYKRVEKVASTDVTVLVMGETGTGKELIAKEIHERSMRRRGPFITINCGAIPENLMESELFGHVKGAFTGATGNQIGKFEAAHGGTLFLDEIGELPLHLQVKILRALQQKQIQKVGDSRLQEVDIRVVAATHRDLQKAVESGQFREDLYFRLNVISVSLPPLRERGDDVLLLARYLLARYAKEFDRAFEASNAFDASAISAMLKFPWPGNIRQLENHIKKALILAEGTKITAKDLDLEAPPHTAAPDSVGAEGSTVLPLTEARERWQRAYINHVLALHHGNRTKAARDLGVDPRTVFRHLEKEDKDER